MFACASGNVQLVNLLMEYGAEVNFSSPKARSPTAAVVCGLLSHPTQPAP